MFTMTGHIIDADETNPTMRHRLGTYPRSPGIISGMVSRQSTTTAAKSTSGIAAEFYR